MSNNRGSERSKILIVDDRENNRLVIEDLLRKLKCETKGVSSGEEALKLTQSWIPDLILMDQMMPGLNGVETTERLKSRPEFEHIPILMVTAKNDVPTLKNAFAAGAVDYIHKPVDRTILLARVRSALRTRHAFVKNQKLTWDLSAQKQELTLFTHMVSHDLKSPVVGAASLFNLFLFRLREEHPQVWEDEGMQELLSRIPETFKKMTSFIDTMLEYAMAGKVIGEQEYVSMETLITSVLEHFEPEIKEGIVLPDIAADLPSVSCDPVKIAQVWQNLIANAIKYRGTQESVKIQIAWRKQGSMLLFWIQDNGPGIPKGEANKVFQAFTRFDDTVDGSGIGLATVQRIIHAHQGSIWVDSTFRQGAKFVFELPDPPV